MKNKIFYKSGIKVVSENDEYLVYKKIKKDNCNIYKYLETCNFNNFLNYKYLTNEFEVYPFIKERDISMYDKAINLIYLMGLLHTKTTVHKKIDTVAVKDIFNYYCKKIDDLKSYYLDLQDFIETKEFMSPAEYLLIINISKVYEMLDFSYKEINLWFNEVLNLKDERDVLLHNNLSLDHILIGNDSYIISWDRSTRGCVVYDFFHFFKKEYLSLDMIKLFSIYQSKYKFNLSEMYFFLCIISIPDKITFNNSNYINTIHVKELIDYITYCKSFILKYDVENQECDNYKFKEQNDSI